MENYIMTKIRIGIWLSRADFVNLQFEKLFSTEIDLPSIENKLQIEWIVKN